MKRLNQRKFLLFIYAFAAVVFLCITIAAKKTGGLEEVCTLCGILAVLSIFTFYAELQNVEAKESEPSTQKKHS